MAEHTGREGLSFDDYRLLRLLGAGTFGEVYQGEHRYKKTIVAIKILQGLFSPTMLKDFLLEARTLFRLRHPHIVQLLDFGITDEHPFLVMKYAPGGTLRHRHPSGTQVPLEQVCSYTQQIAAALHYAHHERLIHRDVKPQNLLLADDGHVLLSDFGIAAIAYTDHSLRTLNEAGTLSYMAPEQIQRKPRPASDQYALAVCVYEWLTGTRPFRGDQWEIMHSHLVTPPPPLRAKVPTLPATVEAVVLKALAKNPQDRFTTIQAFATALEQACLSSQIATTAPSLDGPQATPSVQSSSRPPSTLLLPSHPSLPAETLPPSPRGNESTELPGTLPPSTVPVPPFRPPRRHWKRTVLLLIGLLTLLGGGSLFSFQDFVQYQTKQTIGAKETAAAYAATKAQTPTKTATQTVVQYPTKQTAGVTETAAAHAATKAQTPTKIATQAVVQYPTKQTAGATETATAHAATKAQTPTKIATQTAATSTLHGCPLGYACIYPEGAGWNGDRPSHKFYYYDFYQLSNQYNYHYIVNNQTGGALFRLCTDWNGNTCSYTLSAGYWTSYNLTPINSVRLQA
jgi:serine/threonine protein kinase